MIRKLFRLPAQVLPSSFRVYPGRQRQWKEPGELSQMCSQPCSDSRHRSTPEAGEQTEQFEHLYGLIQLLANIQSVTQLGKEAILLVSHESW